MKEATSRIVSNLTRWEVGQDLIVCYDTLCEKDGEIRNSGFIEESDALRAGIDAIANVFNKNNVKSHGFGLGTTEHKAKFTKQEPK